MMRSAIGFIGLAALLAACAAAPAEERPAAATESPRPAADPSAPSASPSVCEEIIVRYRQTRQAGSSDCKVDADCLRYGGVDPEDVCGGVTNAETGKRLRRIDEELTSAGCPRLPYSCPAMDPRCDTGACR